MLTLSVWPMAFYCFCPPAKPHINYANTNSPLNLYRHLSKLEVAEILILSESDLFTHHLALHLLPPKK